MNIIILSEQDQIDKKQYRIYDERFLHIRNILKSELNDIIEIGLLDGPTGKAKIITLNKKEIIIEIISLEKTKKSSHNIDLI